MTLKTIEFRNNCLYVLDQTVLPQETVFLNLSTCHQVIIAIRELRIRGAPAIGVAAAYALVLASFEEDDAGVVQLRQRLSSVSAEIEKARPTAISLAWALNRLLSVVETADTVHAARSTLLEEAHQIAAKDEWANYRMAYYGAPLISYGSAVLTHCNTGALATTAHGTALGVVRTAWRQSRLGHVYVTETRPLLQGSRLTAWELLQEKIPFTLITDSAAGVLMNQGKLGCVMVGADRIAANGDVANKIGSYSLAVLARQHDVPFYVVAPTNTVDFTIHSGQAIPIEEREADEVTHIRSELVAPKGVTVYNPAFDVTPHYLIAAIVTEFGIVRPPYTSGLAQICTLAI